MRMKAVVLDEERRLELRECPSPSPPTGRSLVDVRAAGVNYADVLIREGRYPQSPPLPYVPGSEIAGETADGRRVIALRPRATAAATPSGRSPTRTGSSTSRSGRRFEQGAAFLLAFLTAWIPLTRQVRVGEGTRVLVTAAAGGVGSAGVQVARALGAEVVGAVGSAGEARPRPRARREAAVTYEEIPDLEPFDVDPRPGRRRALRDGPQAPAAARHDHRDRLRGRAWPPVDPALLVGRNVSACGLLPRPLHEAATRRRARGGASSSSSCGRQGAIEPVVGATFPLAEADAALRLVADRRSTGKVVLVP